MIILDLIDSVFNFEMLMGVAFTKQVQLCVYANNKQDDNQWRGLFSTVLLILYYVL